jgi:hypothetical protein
MEEKVMWERTVSTFQIWKHEEMNNLLVAVNVCNMEEKDSLYQNQKVQLNIPGSCLYSQWKQNEMALYWTWL